jgi:hypothetical protein
MRSLILFILLFALPALAVPTALTVQEISETAWTQSLTAGDTSNGNSILNPSGDVFLVLSSATDESVFTIASQADSVEIPGYGTLTKSDLAITVAAGATKIVGPLNTRAWNDSAGKIQITYTGAGTPSLKALRLKPSLRN